MGVGEFVEVTTSSGTSLSEDETLVETGRDTGESEEETIVVGLRIAGARKIKGSDVKTLFEMTWMKKKKIEMQKEKEIH